MKIFRLRLHSYTRTYVTRESGLVGTCKGTHLHVSMWHGPLIRDVTHRCVTWLMNQVLCHIRDTCKSCHISMSHVTYQWVMSHLMQDVTCEWVVSRMNVSCQVQRIYITLRMSHVTYEWVSSHLELQVSFAKEPYKRDYILQKRPITEWVMSHTNESRHSPNYILSGFN